MQKWHDPTVEKKDELLPQAMIQAAFGFVEGLAWLQIDLQTAFKISAKAQRKIWSHCKRGFSEQVLA